MTSYVGRSSRCRSSKLAAAVAATAKRTTGTGERPSACYVVVVGTGIDRGREGVVSARVARIPVLVPLYSCACAMHGCAWRVGRNRGESRTSVASSVSRAQTADTLGHSTLSRHNPLSSNPYRGRAVTARLREVSHRACACAPPLSVTPRSLPTRHRRPRSLPTCMHHTSAGWNSPLEDRQARQADDRHEWDRPSCPPSVVSSLCPPSARSPHPLAALCEICAAGACWSRVYCSA